MAVQGRSEVLQLRNQETLGVVSLPGTESWRIRSFHLPPMTGRGEIFQNGNTPQLMDGLFEVNVAAQKSWLDREFASPEEAAVFVNGEMAQEWPTIVASLEGRRVF